MVKSPARPIAAIATPAAIFATDAAFLRSVLSTVPTAMVVIDATGVILSFSAAAERLFGYDEPAIIGKNVAILMPLAERAQHDFYINRYLETGVARIIGVGRVLVARRRDGTTFPIELSIGEARTPAGRIFTGFIRDLTERQATERRLQDLQAELSRISRISAMGSLAAALAHELNQPLTAIANYLEAARDLLDQPTGAPGAGTLALVHEAVTEGAAQSIRAGQIVRRLRDFIARGDSDKRIEVLDKLVAEAHALALTGIGTGSVDIRIDLDPAAVTVFVDRIQIQQVLFNLLRNAIEARGNIEPKRIIITARAATDGLVQLTVADNGPGVAAETALHLFEPFRSSTSGGMGMGLSICRDIVEVHGGRIWCEAVAGGGTAFHFTLMAGTQEHDHGR